MTAALPNTIYSRQRLAAAIVELREYLQILRTRKIQQAAKLKKQTAYELSAEAQELLIINRCKEDVKKITDLIQELSASQSQLPEIHIILAGYPSQTAKARITEWFRSNIQDSLLVSFSVDRNIIGGAVVRCGESLVDGSYRTKLLEQKNRIPELASHV